MNKYKFIQRLPARERLSVPRYGQTLLSNTRKWAESILITHRNLIKALNTKVGLDQCKAEYWGKYAFIKYNDALKLDDKTVVNLYSAALILNWIVGRVLGKLQCNASFVDAENWFLGRESGKTLSGLDVGIQLTILRPLRSLDLNLKFLDILPYAVEVFETSDEILNAFGPLRKSKRYTGIFYTPSDVSDYIINYSFLIRKQVFYKIENYTWLDPACGTGCMLISALYKMAKELELAAGEETLTHIVDSLFGIDISPLALQSAAYILVLISQPIQNLTLQESLFCIGKNLCVFDSTKIKDQKVLSSLLPSLISGANFVVSNPPYIRRYGRQNNCCQMDFALDIKFQKENIKFLYIEFIKMLSTLSHLHQGAGGMVVPLSITYNTHKEFCSFRNFVIQDKGNWWFANFDRTPDSLFGDDVKTRNSIIFFMRESNKKKSICTSDLVRWSSRNRAEIFKQVKFSKNILPLKSNKIPKISQKFGQKLLYFFQNQTHRIKDLISPLDKNTINTKLLLRNAKTAYNWLPFEILLTSSFDPDLLMRSKSKYIYWTTKTEDKIPLALALTQSRFAYWLWRVWGDGFHLNKEFILSLPFSTTSFSRTTLIELSELGKNLWIDMQNHKVITKNAGIISYTYCPYVSEKILDRIDGLIIREYGLPKQTLNYLKEILKQTIVAGREKEIDSNPALNKWRLKEEECEKKIK